MSCSIPHRGSGRPRRRFPSRSAPSYRRVSTVPPHSSTDWPVAGQPSARPSRAALIEQRLAAPASPRTSYSPRTRRCTGSSQTRIGLKRARPVLSQHLRFRPRRPAELGSARRAWRTFRPTTGPSPPGVRWTRRRGARPEERAQHPEEHGLPGDAGGLPRASPFQLAYRSCCVGGNSHPVRDVEDGIPRPAVGVENVLPDAPPALGVRLEVGERIVRVVPRAA